MSTLYCDACNIPIPAGARFCGRCGRPTGVDQADGGQQWADRKTAPLVAQSDLPTLANSDLSTYQTDWNWQRDEQDSPAPFSPENALLPLAGASIGPAPVNVPVVQGSPQIGGVPSLQGTPQGSGSAMTQAPLQQPSAGAGGYSAPANAPSAPVNSPSVGSPHHQRPHRGWPRKRHQEPHHQPSHHLHNSGHLHHSGALHSTSQTLHKHAGRTATRGLKHLGRWHLKSVFMAVSVCVLGGLAALLLIPLLSGHAHMPPATLILNGNVVPGGSISIQGRNFTPGGTITFTIDGQSASTAAGSSTAQSPNLPTTSSVGQVSLLQLVQQMSRGQAGAGSTTVKNDGSFETTVQIDPQWAVGSSHVLVATEQSSGQQARLTIIVPRPAKLVSCASTANTTSIVLGPLPEGQAQPASAGFALCTTGSGLVQWTASWNKQQVKWLQVEQTGSIQAPLSKQLTISASATGLKAGSYNAIVTFTDQNGLKVSLKVTFIVRSARATACLNTSTQSLTFTAAQGQANPGSQMVTLTNCGSSGSWSATSHTDDGANWLNVNPASGQLNGKASSAVSVSASSSLLGQGIYTGQVTFKMGSAIAVVNVILDMQPSPKGPSCMSVAPLSLAFSATQGQGNPGSQTVAIGNCGPAAAWSATTSTTDGANWLTVNPGSGNLTTNTSANISVAVSGANLQAGTYSGQVTFKMGSSSQAVSVSFTIVQQQQKPCLSVNPQSLPFTATQGQGNPAPQTVMLTNCGPGGSWSASTTNGSGWLGISPLGNTLNAGASQKVIVSASLAGLSANTYTDTITFTIKTSTGTYQAMVAVTLTVQQPSPPCLQVNPGKLSFTGTQGQGDPTAQTVTLTNCGADGSWSASTVNGSSWLNINPTNSPLSAGSSQSVTISPSLAGLKASTYTDTIVFIMKNGGGATRQVVAVALTVLPPPAPPCLSITSIKPGPASDGVVYVYAGSTITVVVTNCGSDTGTLSSADSTGWLSDNLPSGTTLTGGGNQTITITVASTAPSGNNGTVTITLTTSGGQVSKTITVGVLYPIG